MITDFMIDYESLGKAPDGAVVDLACIAFKLDVDNPPTFETLISNAFHVKFDLKCQKGSRVFDADTIDWWKQQPIEARRNLKVSDNDVHITEMYPKLMAYLESNGLDKWKSHGYCRGQSFDFPMLISIIRQVYKIRDTFEYEPCKFWNQRDVRTAIENIMMTRDMTTVVLPMGTLDGFILHNSIHDCAKAILELIYARRYALGLEDIPENPDPLSLKKSR